MGGGGGGGGGLQRPLMSVDGILSKLTLSLLINGH